MSERIQPSATAPLSEQLREAVREIHGHLEKAPFLQRVFRTQISRSEYALYLSLLHPIYCCLEEGIERHRAHPSLAPLHLPWIFRKQKIEADLAYLGAVPAAPSTLALARRIAEVTLTSPHLLVAHFYVRYFGDLYGGQILAGKISSALGLTAEKGLSFYQFQAPEGAEDCKQGLRHTLDTLALSEADRTGVVAESLLAFQLHTELFERLEKPA